MSGFDVNVLSTKPIIREAASMQNDGGAGNLGYMQQGESKDKEKKKKALEESIFSGKNECDSFVFENDLKGFEDDGFSVAKFIAKVIVAVKRFLKLK